MRRIKVILAVVAAVATMMVMSAPAMAQDLFVENASCPGFCAVGSFSGVDDDFGIGGNNFDFGEFGDVSGFSGPGLLIGGNGGFSTDGGIELG